jgi:inner membrane protein
MLLINQEHIMKFAFAFKVISIFILTILMSWAVSIVNSLITERQQRQYEVKEEIAASSARAQTMVGPVLVVHFEEEYPEMIGQGKTRKLVQQKVASTYYYYPDDLDLKGNFSNEVKPLGIYKALMYQLAGNIQGSFKLSKNLSVKLKTDKSTLKITSAYLSLGVSDARGLTGKPTLNWNGQPASFEQGTKLEELGSGINAPIQIANIGEAQTIAFDLKLNLRGMESFNFVPLADSNTIALTSTWQHPHFGGSFLPDAATQKIDANGFKANWAVSSLSSNNQAVFVKGASAAADASSKPLESLSVGFVEPINVYSQSDRATKYGLLFIGLTFAGFFIFEIIKRLRIHPAQYTLVGLAMALFYLLLISLSEHISFALSYLSASFACVGLLGYYLTHVLKSKTHGFMFAGLLTALYGALYGILASEDNALLMGSLLVFGLLALVMIITRKVDWYQISSKDLPANPVQTHSNYDVA